MATKDEIIADYRKALAEAEAQLAKVRVRLYEYIAVEDNMIDYGHVGDLKRIAAKLKELF